MPDVINITDKLLLTTSQAAELLNVSEKTLWNHTAAAWQLHPSGPARQDPALQSPGVGVLDHHSG